MESERAIQAATLGRRRLPEASFASSGRRGTLRCDAEKVAGCGSNDGDAAPSKSAMMPDDFWDGDA